MNMVEKAILRTHAVELENLKQAFASMNTDLTWIHKAWLYLEQAPELGYREEKQGRIRNLPGSLQDLLETAQELNYTRAQAERLFPHDSVRAFSNGIQLDDVRAMQRKLHILLRQLFVDIDERQVRNMLKRMPQWNSFIQYLKQQHIIDL